jgi:hypothetical protein
MKFSQHRQLQQIQNEIEALLSKTSCKIGDFMDGKKYKSCKEHGIYAITDPEDKTVV